MPKLHDSLDFESAAELPHQPETEFAARQDFFETIYRPAEGRFLIAHRLLRLRFSTIENALQSSNNARDLRTINKNIFALPYPLKLSIQRNDGALKISFMRVDRRHLAT